ncbi:MAG: DNA sulfur modification protein DndB [Acidimicrobiia bacterium]
MRISTPAIQYKQGERVMYVSAAPAGDVVNITRSPEDWNPLAQQPHGNRPVDAHHAARIVQYLETEANPVIGALVLYCHPDDITFVPYAGIQHLDEITPGELWLKPSAMYDIGDGLHRHYSEEVIIRRYGRDPDNPTLQRVMGMGQPFILIPEADGHRRAQDYADLQVNVKPPTGSLSLSMNRRQPFNRFMIDDVVRHPDIVLFEMGNRLEFMSDSPGKNSSKWVSFKTLRYITGTLLIGVGERGADRWNTMANEAVSDIRREEALAQAVEFFQGIERLPGLDEVVARRRKMADLREKTLLTSSNVLYGLAYACHLAKSHKDVSYTDALKVIGESVDFGRPQRQPSEADPLREDEVGGYFGGSLVDVETGSIGSGREAWEKAGRKLFRTAGEDA